MATIKELFCKLLNELDVQNEYRTDVKKLYNAVNKVNIPQNDNSLQNVGIALYKFFIYRPPILQNPKNPKNLELTKNCLDKMVQSVKETHKLKPSRTRR